MSFAELQELVNRGWKIVNAPSINSLRIGSIGTIRDLNGDLDLDVIRFKVKDSKIKDANPDGTVSPDEEWRSKELVQKATRLKQELKREAYEIGGSFRGPGIWREVRMELTKDSKTKDNVPHPFSPSDLKFTIRGEKSEHLYPQFAQAMQQKGYNIDLNKVKRMLGYRDSAISREEEERLKDLKRQLAQAKQIGGDKDYEIELEEEIKKIESRKAESGDCKMKDSRTKDHWHTHSRRGGYVIYEGAGTDGGRWKVEGNGERVIFQSLEDAEEHVKLSGDSKTRDKEPLRENMLIVDEEKWGLFMSGGSIGERHDPYSPKRTGTEQEMKETAKRYNSQLTPGEKHYYKIRYYARKLPSQDSKTSDIGLQGACGGVRKFDGSGKGVGNFSKVSTDMRKLYTPGQAARIRELEKAIAVNKKAGFTELVKRQEEELEKEKSYDPITVRDSLYKGQTLTAIKEGQGVRIGESYTVVGVEEPINQVIEAGATPSIVYKLQDSSGNILVISGGEDLFHIAHGEIEPVEDFTDIYTKGEALTAKIGEIQKNMDAARKMGYSVDQYQSEIDKLQTKDEDYTIQYKNWEINIVNRGDYWEAEAFHNTNMRKEMLSSKGLDFLKVEQDIKKQIDMVKDTYTGDPLTEKGKKIMGAMKEQYGEKEGEQVFYASKNKGAITGVDRKTKDSKVMIEMGRINGIKYTIEEVREPGSPSFYVGKSDLDDEVIVDKLLPLVRNDLTSWIKRHTKDSDIRRQVEKKLQRKGTISGVDSKTKDLDLIYPEDFKKYGWIIRQNGGKIIAKHPQYGLTYEGSPYEIIGKLRTWLTDYTIMNMIKESGNRKTKDSDIRRQVEKKLQRIGFRFTNYIMQGTPHEESVLVKKDKFGGITAQVDNNGNVNGMSVEQFLERFK